MKKTILPTLGLAFISVLAACSRTQDRYIDLRTGQPVQLVKDDNTGLLVDPNTHKPVYMYVDTRKNDTIYGKTGEVINGEVVRDEHQAYIYKNDWHPYKAKGEDYKVVVEKDGDIKIKDGDSKMKIDGKTGEKKVKND